MTAGLRTLRLRGRLYRIGRAPDPWSWPDWAHAGPDGTFGNRWDDPSGSYRVLYASSDRLGAFVEVLARFRPDLHVIEELARIEGEVSDPVAPGELPALWLKNRRIGEAAVSGDFADIGHSESLAVIRRDLASRILHHGLPDLDASAIRLSAPRRLTQEISRYVYERTTKDGRRAYCGISYRSRLGDEFRNWAIFEPATEAEAFDLIDETASSRISAEDPDLLRALEILGIRLLP